MAGKYIVNQTAGKRYIILEEDSEKIEGGYFDTDGVWHDMSGPLEGGSLLGKYVVNETGGKRMILLEEDADEIGGGYFESDGTWVPFGESWTVVWDYSMGAPETVDGITLETGGTVHTEMTAEGYKIATNNSSYVMYHLGDSPYTHTKGTYEVTFIPHFNASVNSLRNLDCGIGNTDNGVRINTSYGAFRLYTSSTAGSGASISPITNDTEYTLKVELNEETYKVYVDGELKSSGAATGFYSATSSFLVFYNLLSPNYYVILKSMKFKPEVEE